MNDTTYVVIAIVAALAILGVIAAMLVTIPLQQAKAAPGGIPGPPPGTGCEFTPGGNASKTRCVH